MKLFKKAILPLGFKANAIACGIKKSGKPDLGLIYSVLPAKVACLSTTNKIQAAPLKFNKDNLSKNKVFHAILVNSGNANCFTGNLGIKDAQQTAQCLAKELKVYKKEILLASTGIIGRRMPVDKIKRAIFSLISGLSSKNINKVSKAILTTDLITKEITAQFNIGNIRGTICGIAKGSGMISPDMATMLSFIMTDITISQAALKKALKMAVDNSFNCITVDGCMSTNDMVILLANGAGKNKLIDSGKEFNLFVQALKMVCLELAKLIVKDGEGATKFIEIKVKGARAIAEAKKAALAIANSNLFKTAIYGENPNFGRIVAAAGACGINIKEEKIKVKLGPLYKNEVKVEVNLAQGNFQATVYTSDLTPEYIKINAAYN